MAVRPFIIVITIGLLKRPSRRSRLLLVERPLSYRPRITYWWGYHPPFPHTCVPPSASPNGSAICRSLSELARPTTGTHPIGSLTCQSEQPPAPNWFVAQLQPLAIQPPQARRELRREKQEWLSAELMQRVLNEILMEYHVNRWENGVSSEDQQFFETLERCLLLGKCCRRLDAGEREMDDSGVQLLGLQREHLQDLLPEPQQDLQAMRQRLVPEMEKRLQDKCFSVLCYYRPEYEGNSEVLKMVKCGAMPELLEADKQKQKSERDRNRENQIAITKQTIAYLTVLHRCFGILQELIERHRLASQPELDAELLVYLRLKSKAMFTKLGALLLEELEVKEKSAEVLRGSLGLYQMLGEEFEGLVSEYSRLLELLGNKQWALQEFTKTQG
ncbi:HAUS augmin-like complex subunit 4 [Rhincodon typus]|uniref:HAUS augmin-like complex subunit 4 n=1 Tax=Rhincodon typus TaxID=259920 RepID=UPI00203025EF|nr:HAUS augmin-like complex subunit 4 [Rhincodon typus]